MPQIRERDAVWDEISGPWDVLIIGGGIVGAGILREAAREGLRALLVEAHDYSSGTSSRSSKTGTPRRTFRTGWGGSWTLREALRSPLTSRATSAAR